MYMHGELIGFTAPTPEGFGQIMIRTPDGVESYVVDPKCTVKLNDYPAVAGDLVAGDDINLSGKPVVEVKGTRPSKGKQFRSTPAAGQPQPEQIEQTPIKSNENYKPDVPPPLVVT